MSYQDSGDGHVGAEEQLDVIFIVVWGLVLGYVQMPMMMAVTGNPIGDVVLYGLVSGFLISGWIEVSEYISGA